VPILSLFEQGLTPKAEASSWYPSGCANTRVRFHPLLSLTNRSRQWDEHIADVVDCFKQRTNLLVFDVEKDDIATLIAFFAELNLDKKHWEGRNPEMHYAKTEEIGDTFTQL